MIATPSALPSLLRRRIAFTRGLPIQLRMSRNDLPALCRSLGFTHGAEIGVWKGAYAAQFCQAGLHMLCVDPWVSYPAWVDTKNAMEPEKAARFMESSYQIALARLTPLACTIVRRFSADAAADVPDRSLDVVYIDGNHSAESVTEDLELWTPKVKVGGVIAGHDYRVFANKPTIHVVEAVQAFTKARNIAPWFITAGDRTPSFLWVVA